MSQTAPTQLQDRALSQTNDSSASRQRGGFLPDELLDTLKKIAKVIVETLGNQCEVVIHDLADLQHSIVWIEGNVTGRRIGGSLTNLGLQKLQQEDTTDLFNYQTRSPSGRKLKSSSVFLHDEDDNPVGAFCINWDVSALVVAEQVLRGLTLPISQDGVKETFLDDVEDILESMVHECIVELGKPLELMGREDKVELIKALEERGALRLRQAVPILANQLGISRQTVYNYLNENGSELAEPD